MQNLAYQLGQMRGVLDGLKGKFEECARAHTQHRARLEQCAAIAQRLATEGEAGKRQADAHKLQRMLAPLSGASSALVEDGRAAVTHVLNVQAYAQQQSNSIAGMHVPRPPMRPPPRVRPTPPSAAEVQANKEAAAQRELQVRHILSREMLPRRTKGELEALERQSKEAEREVFEWRRQATALERETKVAELRHARNMLEKKLARHGELLSDLAALRVRPVEPVEEAEEPRPAYKPYKIPRRSSASGGGSGGGGGAASGPTPGSSGGAATSGGGGGGAHGLRAGADVWYREASGCWTAARVERVHYDAGEQPYFELTGTRSTEAGRLRPRALGEQPPPPEALDEVANGEEANFEESRGTFSYTLTRAMMGRIFACQPAVRRARRPPPARAAPRRNPVASSAARARARRRAAPRVVERHARRSRRSRLTRARVRALRRWSAATSSTCGAP